MKKLVIIALLILAVACSKEAPSSEVQEVVVIEPEFPEPPIYSPPPTAPDVANEVSEFKLSVTKQGFFPSEIVVKKGASVRLILLAEDTDHTFTSLTYNIDEELPRGEDVTIEFIAGKEGVSTFFSDVEGAEQVEGTLVVK